MLDFPICGRSHPYLLWKDVPCVLPLAVADIVVPLTLLGGLQMHLLSGIRQRMFKRQQRSLTPFVKAEPV